MSSEPPASAPPGWYPVAEGGKRFWDGREWTSVVVGAQEHAPASSPGDRAIPAVVTAGFWLWWPLIVAQGLVLALCAFVIVETTVTSAFEPNRSVAAGFAIIILGPTALVAAALVVAEVLFAGQLRRGEKRARVALVLLAIFNFTLNCGLYAYGQPAQLWEYGQLYPRLVAGLLTALAIGAALAVIASFLPFSRSAKDFFAHSSATPPP